MGGNLNPCNPACRAARVSPLSVVPAKTATTPFAWPAAWYVFAGMTTAMPTDQNI